MNLKHFACSLFETLQRKIYREIYSTTKPKFYIDDIITSVGETEIERAYNQQA